MRKAKIYRVYKPGANIHCIEADKMKVAQDHIVFTDESEAVLAIIATAPGLVVIDQQSERGAAGLPR
jgi:hypothetical protein